MIYVKSILGESYNLETGEHSPKALMVTNGKSEAMIPVTEESALAVIKLMVELQERPEDPPSVASESLEPVPRLVSLEDPQEPGEWDDPESGVASI